MLNRRYHTNPKFLPYPSKHVSIRGIKEQTYSIIDVTDVGKGGNARVMEEIELSRAMFEAFEGAVVSTFATTCQVKVLSP